MLTFFWRAQWKMKMKRPCKALKVVNRYARTKDSLLMKRRPKAQVRPRRKRRVTAPKAHDLKVRTKKFIIKLQEAYIYI